MTKILVIDDEPTIVKLVQAYLKPEGYEMFTVTDGPCIPGFGIPADHHIETHGGKIWAESTGENKGSVFTFMLPLAK
jgi:hypothetical protein